MEKIAKSISLMLFVLIMMLIVIPSDINAQTEKDNENGYSGSIAGGFGANYGGLGIKLTIGDKDWKLNDGFFGSIGTFKDEIMWELGVQFGYGNLYAAISGGGIGVQTESITINNNGSISTDSETKVILGYSGVAGYNINIGPEKRFYVNLGVGYSWGKTTYFKGTQYAYQKNIGAVTIDFGLGYRFKMF